MSDAELLKYAIENGMIDTAYVRDMIEMQKRKEILEKHPYKIWEGKDGKWYTYLPDEENGRVLKKRKTEKDIQNCSLAQCACIAAITQNPTAHNPLYHPQNNKERRETVLAEMLAQNKISNDEYNEAIKESQNMNFSEKAKKEKASSSKNVRNWYVEALVRDIVADLCEKYHIGKSVAENMIYTQGFKIYSAMDLKAQEFAENAIKDGNIMPKDPNMEIGYIMNLFFCQEAFITASCRSAGRVSRL